MMIIINTNLKNEDSTMKQEYVTSEFGAVTKVIVTEPVEAAALAYQGFRGHCVKDQNNNLYIMYDHSPELWAAIDSFSSHEMEVDARSYEQYLSELLYYQDLVTHWLPRGEETDS